MPPPRQIAGDRKALARGPAINGHGFPWPAIAASLVVHAVIFTLLLHAPMSKRPLPTVDRVITMRLAAPPPSEPASGTETGTHAIEPAPPDQAREPDHSDTVTADAPAAFPAPVVNASKPDTPDSVPEELPAENPAGLRARILEQVGALPETPEADEKESLPWTTTGETVPDLPGVRGWLSGHVGPVRPGADTWKAGDGSSRGRYVMADGTVVCSRRRAPTIDELMNPWKSTMVTMARICGRERPDAPDFTDPRVQPPPRRGVRDTPGLDD